MAPVPYYERHIFFCLNDREKGEKSCAHDGAKEGFDHCKSRVKKARPVGPGQGARQQGRLPGSLRRRPVAVVYPEGVWYTYVDSSDIDEIVDSHLMRGEVVTRLLLPPDVGR